MAEFSAEIKGVRLAFETAPKLFSPRGIDPGTAAMLRQVQFKSQDKVLDLGCGYGVVGIYAAHCTDPERVWLVDVDPAAVEFAKRNLHLNGIRGATVVISDGFRSLSETQFTKILCNPPYHVDFSVPKRLIEKGFNRLALGGSMILVCKRDAWYRNKLRAVFGNVQIERDNGYVVFEATKASTQYANKRRSASHPERP